jgi:hypothetical protein
MHSVLGSILSTQKNKNRNKKPTLIPFSMLSLALLDGIKFSDAKKDQTQGFLPLFLTTDNT